MAPIVIHHMHVSQSERIPWLCEELGVPYELKEYRRSPVLAPPEIVSLHPSGTVPVIEDGDLMLAESCAILEYIAHRHGGGRLFVGPSDPAYADFLFWWHWADGTLQPAMLRVLYMGMARLEQDHSSMLAAKDRRARALRQLEDRLAANRWLAGGDRFTAADVMVVFSLTTARRFAPVDLGEYPNILRFLADVGEREAYKTAMAKCEPDLELALGAAPPKSFFA
ncbi:hypothetical protein GGTG_03588 [Gaeumannomyces tritici R3-111a-1]|uniref:Glutathione S-transferase n=1 Tax=Gaeumannomyces tritici (strain R3-111a-1) TaxID=644352 RepID=J3NQN2_GAET3|nr:hypothetical protein GGTG_03588 [Gaeumannomyces tritici R3-111a-1]EJT78488.1 hypothetical protein GGTG_03588 [Gaeumannomyces tritici R3-111a-1]